MRKIVAKEKINCEDLIGSFVGEKHYDTLITEDCDFHMPVSALHDDPEDELNIGFKFRKNVFPQELVDIAYENMKTAAVRSENRGLASGIKDGTVVDGEGREWVTNYQEEMLRALIQRKKATLDDSDPIVEIRKKYPTIESRKVALGGGKNNVWVISRFRGKFDFDTWLDSIIPLNRIARAEAAEETKKMTSQTSYGLPVNSGIAGFYDRYPRIPYGRACSFNQNNPEKFAAAVPYFQLLGKYFKELMPKRYAAQMEECAKLDSRFLVPNTPFTTITVNSNYRTAAHLDAGDLNKGFSNLTVVSNGLDYSGGYLIFPEYRAAVDVRPGDLLLINNHEIIHGNTPIIALEEGAERLSFVAYFRENMVKLGSYEYEKARYDFIEQRRLNKDHPMQKTLWNGVSEGWSESQEWFDWLRNELGENILYQYHSNARPRNTLF